MGFAGRGRMSAFPLSGVVGVAPACALAGAFVKARAQPSSGLAMRSIVVCFGSTTAKRTGRGISAAVKRLKRTAAKRGQLWQRDLLRGLVSRARYVEALSLSTVKGKRGS